MKPSDKIKRAHVDIMRHKTWCAMSGLLACGEVTLTDTIKTACTNGWDTKYSPEFIDSLEHEEIRFVVLHETLHKAYRHLTMWKKLWAEDAKLTNVAADHFVNLAIAESDNGEGFVKMPKIGIQPDPQYHGMSVEQIYRLLKEEQEQNPQKPQGGEGGSGDGEPSMDEHDWEGAGDKSAEAQEAQGKEIERAMRQGEIVRRKRVGQGSGTSSGVFGDLLKAKVNWREVLREFVQSMCQGDDESSWRKVNRRFLHDDVYMPSLVGERMTELVVLLDTSGSCFGGSEMTRFVSELATIIEQIKPEKTHVLYVDAEVAGHQTFEGGQFAVQNLKPRGGGGTDLPVAFSYLAAQKIKPQAVVVLTDGYTPFGSPPEYPVLWAMTSQKTAPYGTTLHIGE